jgi:hypothetical protein
MNQILDKPHANAVSESGTPIRYADDVVNLALKLVVLNGGQLKPASEQLRAEGFDIHRNTLRDWRDRQFPRRYHQIRGELGQQVTEEIAGRALERALEADGAEQKYIEAAIARLDEVDATHLAKNALALANAKAQNIEKSQLLRERPTQITENRSVADLVGTLERLGVAKKVQNQQVTEGETEETENGPD